MALTPRELQVLQLLATGHGYKAIAVQWRISVQCVYYYARQARCKLKADTMEQAVARAMQRGLITIPVETQIIHSIMTKPYTLAN
jgi:DNA-binding CsgD family transcriptional regulator